MPKAIVGSWQMVTCVVPCKSKNKKKFTFKMCFVPFLQEKKKKKVS